MEPSVKILYSESDNLNIQPGAVMSLGIANSLFEQQDIECEENQVIENVVYEISCFTEDDTRTYCCSQNLGDGDGSVINHLRKNAIEVLETLKGSRFKGSNINNKNPISILQTSYENMLRYILPELEVYCIAYKAHDVIESYNVDNCDKLLLSDVPFLMSAIKTSSDAFIESLERVVEKNPDNTSLISSIEVIIIKTEQYLRLVNNQENYKDSIIDVLKEATKRATVINSNSSLYYYDAPEPNVMNI